MNMKVMARVLLTLVLGSSAWAHDQHHPELDTWFRGLGSMRSPCCAGEDGNILTDMDWTQGDTKDCKPTGGGLYNDNDAGTEYCVRVKGTWWLVPDSAVVHEPNRLGPAILWPVWSSPNSPDEQLNIRCFLPGAGT